MTEVFIATPMYGGLCYGDYAYSLMRTPAVLSESGIALQYRHIGDDSLIPSARNTLANDFLETCATHLMWIDADIGFNPADIVTMIRAEKDIICGLYPRKTIDWERLSQAVKDGVQPSELKHHATSPVYGAMPGVVASDTEPYEIAVGGCGFMLVKRKVLESLKVPTYVRLAWTPNQKPIKEFHTLSIDDRSGGVLLSEDYHFCKLARIHGFAVHAAPWVRLTHSGRYIFT